MILWVSATMRLLIDRDADKNAGEGQYGSAVRAAALGGDMSAVQFLAKRINEIPITEEILKEVLRSWNAVQLMNLFPDEIEDKLFITEEVLVTAAQSESVYDLMALLLGSSVKISDDHILV